MAVSRPGLTDKTGHAAVVIGQTPLTNEEIVVLVENTSETKKQEIIEEIELALPPQGGVVTSFNGLTGAVQGVSEFNGLTGSVSFIVDGGEL